MMQGWWHTGMMKIGNTGCNVSGKAEIFESSPDIQSMTSKIEPITWADLDMYASRERQHHTTSQWTHHLTNSFIGLAPLIK